MKFAPIVILCLFFTSVIFSQTKDSIQQKYQTHFKNLSENAGYWTVENPKYNASNPEDFKVFILKVKLKDPLKIDVNFLSVTTKNNTILFWEFSEFYAPDKKKKNFYQRSIDGLYYPSGEATMTETERYFEMTFYNSEGEYLRHNDTHTLLYNNTLKPVSYENDSKSQSWINESIFIRNGKT